LTQQLDPRRLLPGTEIKGRRTPAGELERLTVELDELTSVTLQVENGQVVARRTTREVDRRVQQLSGSITSSLFQAMREAGAEPELAVRIAEVFQWDIDFFRDVRKGDSFEVLVDRQMVEGQHYGYGMVYAARFTNRGRQLYAIAFPDETGRVGYYDLDGHPLRKQFLRSPLKFSRVTSRFSLSRFHPIYKRRMPHYGVDYGAPVGTPVHVTADGVVSLIGHNGGAGRMVRVKHANAYETNYLHLSRYAPGIRSGARVRQGQVIGYVGSSGASTGPHLDYRVKHNHRWVNPLQITSPPVKALAREQLERYLAHAIAVLSLLDEGVPPEGASC